MKLLRSIIPIIAISIFIPQSLYANSSINFGQSFIYLADKVSEDIPESYKYIDLYYTDVDTESEQGRALQKLIYLGLINNTSSQLNLNKEINFYFFEALTTRILGVKIAENVSNEVKKNTPVKEDDLRKLESLLQERGKAKISSMQNTLMSGPSLGEKSKILDDVYSTLSQSHYDRENFDENQIINGAIKGAAESIGDKYTTYFPPVESKNFNESLDGSFEGIGAYIEMPTPGELIIISPIVGSPAEDAGIKGGDRVLSVDGKEVTPENSVSEVVSWIKGPKGSTVDIVIKRGDQEPFTLNVTRDTIIIKDVEHEKLSGNTYYIQIKSFGSSVTSEFKQALEAVKEDTGIKKIIFDVRNNPGGYLDEVAYMLSYFVPEGDPTAIIDYGETQREFTSRGYDLIDPSKYKFVFLQNGGSASASEIMVGTMKDYFPEMTIIGEKSFGKGSVQSLKNYFDGSTLKYTTAKWFTGKTKTGIDGIGITPDIIVELDNEKLENQNIDTQLEAAKRK